MSQQLSTDDIIEFTVWCRDTEQASVNTFHYKVNAFTPGDPCTTEDAAIAMDALLAPLFKPIISNQAEYRGVECKLPYNLPQQRGIISVTGAGNGTGGAVGMSRQTAGLIGWKTIYAGTNRRGRTFLPFPSTADDEGLGLPTSAYFDKLVALAVGLTSFNSVTGGGHDPVPVSFVLLSRKSLVVPGIHTYDITGFGPSQMWATMKKRGSYGRANVSPF